MSHAALRSFRFRSPLWRHGDFLRLWTAQTLSQFTGQVGSLAVPLVAIAVLEVNAFQVGLLATVASLPFLLFSLPVGVVVDRVRRRPVLIAADIVAGLALVSIPLAYLVDVLTIWQLYAVGFTTGTCRVFFDVAYMSYLPSLVTRDELQEGNSKLEVSRSGSMVAGPGFAGVLVEAVTAPYAVAVNAVGLLGSAAFMLGIRRRESEPADVALAPTARKGVRMLREIKDGLVFVVRHPYMRPSMVFITIQNFFTALMFAILLLFAIREVGMTAAEAGFAFALGNIGALIGALVARRAALLVGGIGRALVIASALGGAAWLFVPVTPAEMATAFIAVALGLFGFSAMVWYVVGISLFQATTPDRFLGRANASRRFVVWGINPIGALAGGVLAESVGLRETMWIGAIGASVAFLPLLFSALRSVRTLAEAEAAVGLGEPREQEPVVS
jgi:predicted MFS family arabinose efflux permease